jgi:hypothetical protein
MFKRKSLHFIIPNKILLFKWKIVGNSLCNFCKLDEDYSHYVITCAFLKEFWTKFKNLVKGLCIEYLSMNILKNKRKKLFKSVHF